MKLRSNKTQLRKFQKNAKLKKGKNIKLKGKLRRDGRLNHGPADINDTCHVSDGRRPWNLVDRTKDQDQSERSKRLKLDGPKD